jgi:hypothetical protein
MIGSIYTIIFVIIISIIWGLVRYHKKRLPKHNPPNPENEVKRFHQRKFRRIIIVGIIIIFIFGFIYLMSYLPGYNETSHGSNEIVEDVHDYYEEMIALIVIIFSTIIFGAILCLFTKPTILYSNGVSPYENSFKVAILRHRQFFHFDDVDAIKYLKNSEYFTTYYHTNLYLTNGKKKTFMVNDYEEFDLIWETHKKYKEAIKSILDNPTIGGTKDGGEQYYQCPKCKLSFEAPDRDRPFTIKCPHCGVKGKIG